MELTYLQNLNVNKDKTSLEVKAEGKLSQGTYRIKIELDGGNSAVLTCSVNGNQIESLSTDNSGGFRFYGEWEILEFLEFMQLAHSLKVGF